MKVFLNVASGQQTIAMPRAGSLCQRVASRSVAGQFTTLASSMRLAMQACLLTVSLSLSATGLSMQSSIIDLILALSCEALLILARRLWLRKQQPPKRQRQGSR